MSTIRTLDATTAARLRAAPLTYAPGDATSPRSHTLHRDSAIGAGRDAFERARTALLAWQVQTRAGVRVAASCPVVAVDAVAVVSVGIGPLSIGGPVRVVSVIDEPTRAAFSYGTLPGHPEAGEETFTVVLDDDGAVRFELDGFSRPATILTRLASPVAATVQRAITDRYARSLRLRG